MKRRLADERGMTLIELIFVAFILGIVLTGIASVFVSGTRASSDATGRLTSQQNARLALGRLEFEGRCAASATLLNSGAGVLLSIPSQCPHATGSVSWCVVSGVLTRYGGSTTCSGTGESFIKYVTTPTPFSLLTATGLLPRLQVTLAVNQTGRSSDGTSVVDTITLRNASRS
jgi:prepilin-type N-terminal cleavage/methylation domain-containing protein